MSAPVMPLVDHIVLLVRDLDRADADLTAAGLTVQRRKDISDKPGSSFRFVSFADGSYLLLNAFSAEAMTRHRLGPILGESEGWGDWSIGTDDLDTVIARAQAAGVTLGAENSVTNVLSTGEAWGLRLLVSGRGARGDDALPFFVQDTAGRDARIPVPVPHANGASGIAGLTVASEDPAGSATRLAAMLGMAAPVDAALIVGGAVIRFVPTEPAARGTARLGGPVAVALNGITQDLDFGGWEAAEAKV